MYPSHIFCLGRRRVPIPIYRIKLRHLGWSIMKGGISWPTQTERGQFWGLKRTQTESEDSFRDWKEVDGSAGTSRNVSPVVLKIFASSSLLSASTTTLSTSPLLTLTKYTLSVSKHFLMSFLVCQMDTHIWIHMVFLDRIGKYWANKERKFSCTNMILLCWSSESIFWKCHQQTDSSNSVQSDTLLLSSKMLQCYNVKMLHCSNVTIWYAAALHSTANASMLNSLTSTTQFAPQQFICFFGFWIVISIHK